MTIDKKELTKLSPKERIKKLKLMEDERKKEVDEIEILIRQSMHELKTDMLAEDVAPEPKLVDISRLFEATGEHGLERTAREEASPNSARGSRGYQAIVQTYEAYSQAMRLSSAVSMGGRLSEEEKRLMGNIIERVNTAERYMTEGEKASSKLDATRAVLYKLKKETGLG